MPDLVGEKLGRYEITARVADSALAEVYRAYSPALGREVAVKVYRPHLAADPTLVERLRGEARRVAALRHPHIAPVYDCDVATVAGQPLLYVVGEFAEGATLKERLAALKVEGRTMPLAEAAALVRAIAAALDYAHGRGVIHGGLKPSNVLFGAEGEPMVADFGVARVVAASLQALPTDPAGAPAYMASEQIRGDPLDGRADVYALGVILYELCTNTLPFTADTATGVLMRHLTEPPPPPTRANPSLPPAVEGVILKALSKAPADRYAKAGELAAALDAALSGVSVSAEVSAPAAPPARKGEGEAQAPSAAVAEKGEKGGREGVRSLLLGLMALFTAAVSLIEKSLKAVDILRNPLIGFIVVALAVVAMVASAGYVLARPQLYKPWQRRLALAGLVLVLLAATGWGGWTVYDMQRPPKGLIVLIADFEQAPGARAVNYARRIETGLNEALNQLQVEGVYVERSYEVYTEKDARAKAAARKAAVVIYGWYDDAGVNPRFELVRAPQQYLPLLKQAPIVLADLDRLELRVDRELKEMSYIAAAAIGLVYYADGQNDQALPFFDLALRSAPAEAQILGKEAVYFYKGATHFYLHQFPQAVAALEEAVRLDPELYPARRNLAVAYSVACDPAAALREIDEALHLRPEAGDAYYLRGVLLMARSRWDEAAAALARAAELSPDDPAIHAALGQAYREIGRPAEAEAALARAASLSETALTDREKADDPEAVAAYGNALLSAGRFEEAVAAYQQAIDVGTHGRAPLRPDRLAWLYRSLGRALWDLERWEEMATAYQQAIELSPGLPGDHTALAAAYQGLGQTEQAIAAYRQALDLLPCDALTHALLAGFYRKLGRSDEALAEYRLAVQYDPDDFGSWQVIGQLLEERGEAEEAQAAYAQAIALAEDHLARNPHDAATTAMLGLMLLLRGETERAIALLQQAVALRPTADNHYALGNAYYDAGRYEEALAAYRAALAADPGHFAAAARLGSTYEQLDRPDEAIAAYRRALAIQDDADVRAYLGMALAKQGETEAAEAEYQASLGLADNVLARVGLAALYEQAGRLDRAIAELEAALRLRDDPAIRRDLARLYERLGRLEEAAAHYRAAVARLAPDNPVTVASRVALAGVWLRLCRADEAASALQEAAVSTLEAQATLAAAYEAQGKTAEAERVYAALVQAQPQHAGAHYLAAWFAYRQDRLDEAIAAMREATKLAPAFSLARSSLGFFHDLRGDRKTAQTAYEQALATMPANVQALMGLGALALQEGDPAAALGYFQEARQKQPEYVRAVPDEAESTLVSIHLNTALAYERLGRRAEAERELAAARQLAEAAVAKLPTHPQARYQLGLVYRLAGELEKAEAAFAEAARCNASLAGERLRFERRLAQLRGK
ncbi:MAG: tetratricopeptide repeat protein [Anaerolineae bacterium]|nr:tetratricopeptide repeat protein [Anaerolineae bacterium]